MTDSITDEMIEALDDAMRQLGFEPTENDARRILSAIAAWNTRAPDPALADAKPQCRARRFEIPDDPGQCDWPLCGCDPVASKVIEALEEGGNIADPKALAEARAEIERLKEPNPTTEEIARMMYDAVRDTRYHGDGKPWAERSDETRAEWIAAASRFSARLTRELAEAREENSELVAQGKALSSDVTVLGQELAEAREALEPLVKEALKRQHLALGPDIDHWPIGGSELTYGDLRRAAALAKKDPTP